MMLQQRTFTLFFDDLFHSLGLTPTMCSLASFSKPSFRTLFAIGLGRECEWNGNGHRIGNGHGNASVNVPVLGI